MPTQRRYENAFSIGQTRVSLTTTIYCLRRSLPALIGLTLISMQAPAEPKLQDVEYAIISAAVKHGVGGKTATIIIDGLTTGAVVNVSDTERPEAELVAELGTTAIALREWLRLNRKRFTLQAQLTSAADYVLLPQNDRQQIFNQTEPAANWDRFRARFPGSAGIIRVSRPGIDDVNGNALLYLEFECGAQCGSGRLVNLRRNPAGEWQVSDGTLVWITAPD
jgi:hypothetical protein